ncbi:transposase [Planctomonas sp. JC2975]|nr:transposase [Planctomonas sp. JC2975]
MDARWSLIEPMLPRPTGRKGRPFSDARTMLEGTSYRYRCGIARCDLPESFGRWLTVVDVAKPDGDRRNLGPRGHEADCRVGGGSPDRLVHSVDWTIARAHQHAMNTTRTIGAETNCTNLQEEPPDQENGRSCGGLLTKIHQLVDGRGPGTQLLFTVDNPRFLDTIPATTGSYTI